MSEADNTLKIKFSRAFIFDTHDMWMCSTFPLEAYPVQNQFIVSYGLNTQLISRKIGKNCIVNVPIPLGS